MSCKKKVQEVIGINKHSKFKHDFSSKHRAVSDIIVSLLLIAITVVMGSILFSFFSGSDSPTVIVETIQDRPATTSRDIIISGYDTRDGNNIGDTDLCNSDNDGTTCNSTTDGALKSGEYISLTIRDRGQDDIQLSKLNINEIQHAWEVTSCTISSTGALTDCTESLDNGEFVIIGGDNPSSGSVTTNVSQLILQGQEKRLIIKLSDDLADINLNKAIRVGIIVANFEPTEFIISAGGTR